MGYTASGKQIGPFKGTRHFDFFGQNHKDGMLRYCGTTAVRVFIWLDLLKTGETPHWWV